MQINSCSIQDMYIFGDPSHAPVVFVEQQAINLPNYTDYHLDQNGATNLTVPAKDVVPRFLEPKKTGRVLRVVVFVHGFQACAPSLLFSFLFCMLT